MELTETEEDSYIKEKTECESKISEHTKQKEEYIKLGNYEKAKKENQIEKDEIIKLLINEINEIRNNKTGDIKNNDMVKNLLEKNEEYEKRIKYLEEKNKIFEDEINKYKENNFRKEHYSFLLFYLIHFLIKYYYLFLPFLKYYKKNFFAFLF